MMTTSLKDDDYHEDMPSETEMSDSAIESSDTDDR